MEVCGYCGEPRGDALSCCGECHWDDLPECPKCGSEAVNHYSESYECWDCEHVWQPSGLGLIPDIDQIA